MRKVSNVNVVEQRKQFAHAVLEARLRESFISIEYRDVKPLKDDDAVWISEPLHDESPARIVEAVENIATKIASTSARTRCKVISTPLEIMSADVKLAVLEFKEIE